MDDSDWSSSDDEQGQEIETSVLLGIPDGLVNSASDLEDAAVSRIGGHPALLPSFEPSFESTHCRHCAEPMELLVQLWCPFEGSYHDRALYIWACARSGCQRKDGCVRAWRGLRYNAEYARKLQRKFTSTTCLKTSRTECAPSAANPFMSSVRSDQQMLGLGSKIFQEFLDTPRDIEDDKAEVHSNSSASSIIQALASTVLSDSWKTAPYYPPQYLSTVSEFIPSHPKKQAPPAEVPNGDIDVWSSEKYENSMHTDCVFDHFVERVALESQQCVRYDLGGKPLPFATDSTFKKLFASDLGDTTLPAMTGGGLDGSILRGEYRLTPIPACPSCGSKRTFECQLMPNLINILEKHERGIPEQKDTDLERRQQMKAIVSGDDSNRGMEWGTILVFSCEKDCCPGSSDQNHEDAWMEEIVMVQWDIKIVNE